MVMAEQEWQELNSTCGNNGRNLREISKHQELSCGTRNLYICEIINFPMFYYFTTRSITDHTTEFPARARGKSFLIASDPRLCPGLTVS